MLIKYSVSACADPEGGYGVRTPSLKNDKNIGFLSNIGPDPLKNHKATKPAFNLDHHRHASETPFKWRFAGGPMMARLLWYIDPISPDQLKKNVVKVGPPLTTLSGSAHAQPQNTIYFLLTCGVSF